MTIAEFCREYPISSIARNVTVTLSNLRHLLYVRTYSVQYTTVDVYIIHVCALKMIKCMTK